MKKSFTIPATADPSIYAPCQADLILTQKPIEDHPAFCNPDVRFCHVRIRNAYRAAKASGIESFMVQEWRITPD
jgi:hypothetical protein